MWFNHKKSDDLNPADEYSLVEEEKPAGPYDPYAEYLKQRINESADVNEYNFKPQTLDKPKVVFQQSKLVNFAFFLSIFSLACLFLSNIYLALLGAILALTASLITRFVGNTDHRFQRRAFIAMVISIIVIAFTAFIIIFQLYIYPELLKDPSFREMIRELQGEMPDYFPPETQAVLPDEIL